MEEDKIDKVDWIADSKTKARRWDIQAEMQKLQAEGQKLLKELEDVTK